MGPRRAMQPIRFGPELEFGMTGSAQGALGGLDAQAESLNETEHAHGLCQEGIAAGDGAKAPEGLGGHGAVRSAGADDCAAILEPPHPDRRVGTCVSLMHDGVASKLPQCAQREHRTMDLRAPDMRAMAGRLWVASFASSRRIRSATEPLQISSATTSSLSSVPAIRRNKT